MTEAFCFEVEGADAVVKHLVQFDTSGEDKHHVWMAIAVHTSPHIAERVGELSRLVRLAKITDLEWRSEACDVLKPMKAMLEHGFQRGGIEKVLGDAVVDQAKKKAEKARK